MDLQQILTQDGGRTKREHHTRCKRQAQQPRERQDREVDELLRLIHRFKAWRTMPSTDELAQSYDSVSDVFFRFSQRWSLRDYDQFVRCVTLLIRKMATLGGKGDTYTRHLIDNLYGWLDDIADCPLLPVHTADTVDE